ncbi:hypothetical protein QVD17_20717 [Tagetes erecta]|uniref:Uncharacterized protein n=1 Tax=Tagetes erecta TaxID=13708 RepID=A0AAD8KQF6_TARER|nr:hypothetical protein QVD17_20717 [Tagetes erecta]
MAACKILLGFILGSTQRHLFHSILFLFNFCSLLVRILSFSNNIMLVRLLFCHSNNLDICSEYFLLFLSRFESSL